MAALRSNTAADVSGAGLKDQTFPRRGHLSCSSYDAANVSVGLNPRWKLLVVLVHALFMVFIKCFQDDRSSPSSPSVCALFVLLLLPTWRKKQF